MFAKMYPCFRSLFLSIITWIVVRKSNCTIDLNAAELQYLSDHLTREECRKLIAAAHLKGFEEPNILDQAERAVSKDMPCIELLHHWNSEKGEGKGETHEVLEHRLRQMGKIALADWLGKTVFHEIGKDLNDSIETGFKEFLNESTQEAFEAGPTLVPAVETQDPRQWTPVDTILYSIMVGLFLILLCLCCGACLRWRRNKRNRKVKFKKPERYTIIDESSGSESEEKFDVRRYSDRLNFTSSEGEHE